MSDAGNPLTDEQHRLFAEELAGIKAQLEQFRVALDTRYGQDFAAAASLAHAIAALTEAEQHMQARAAADLQDLGETIYGQSPGE